MKKCLHVVLIQSVACSRDKSCPNIVYCPAKAYFERSLLRISACRKHDVFCIRYFCCCSRLQFGVRSTCCGLRVCHCDKCRAIWGLPSKCCDLGQFWVLVQVGCARRQNARMHISCLGLMCSAGNHVPGQRVTWTGSVSSAQIATGVSINWSVTHQSLVLL